ncbi:MAG: hypothetical protein ACSHX9_15620 [Luteolibacter sp.]
MKPNNRKALIRLGAIASGMLALGSAANAADIDVVATQLAFNATYGLDTLSGDQTWTKDNIYILTDRIYVPDGVTLTIEPGTKIYSTFDDKGTTEDTSHDTVGAVIVARGGTINAQGCAGDPIVFDALQTLEVERNLDLPYDTNNVIGPAPTRGTGGLWGGVVILGNSSISLVDASDQPVRNDVIEGFTPASAADTENGGTGDGFSDILEYGYDELFAQDEADNSGVLSYVSIRHGGYTFGPDNEINGLTLGGVGSGTTIDHVEVYANLDDGVEFFGGSVNTSNLVVAFCQDDSFDIDQGHSGTHQFWFAIQDKTTGGDNLGEWDGIDTNDGGPKGTTTNPNILASSPKIYNATFVGSGFSAAGGDNGLFLDDQFNGELYNSILHDQEGSLASFSSDGSFGGLGNSFANNIVGNFGTFVDTNDDVIAGTAPAAFYQVGGTALNGNTDAGTSPGFGSYTRNMSGDLTNIDPRPTSLNTTVTTGAPVEADYRGAFDSTNNWAVEWTKLGEEGAFGTTYVDVVGSQTVFNASYGLKTLVRDECWTADNVYILTDRVYVPDGVTLTIEAGTKIYGTSEDQGTTEDTSDDTVGALIIARGGMINAQGTACDPIVFDGLETLEAELNIDLEFDSDSTIGPAPTRATGGLWGGVVILGNSSISLVDASDQPVRNDVIEGFTPASAADTENGGTGDGFSDILEYGYDELFAQDEADNSGVFSYVSIRHGGYTFGPDNEINGLTLGGVGSGTTIDHVEVYANLDDGIEFFGGSVNTSNLAVAFCQDDSFDIDQGHSGTHQFWFAIQDKTTGGDNLGEWDGIDTNDGGPKGTTTNPNILASSPKIYNATFVGSGFSAAGGDNGLFLDDQFNGELYNSILHDQEGSLASFSSDGSFGGLGNGFANNIVGNFGTFVDTNDDVIAGTAPAAFYQVGGTALNGNTDAGTAPGFAAYTRDGSSDLTGIDPRPITLNTTVTAGAPTFAPYRGAFGGDNSENWTACWTKLSETDAMLIDTDEDGIYDNVDTDDDGDGLSDADELAAGTDPKVADSAALVAALNSGGGITDTDGDGISDDLENTAALIALGFDAAVNNVSSTNLFSDIFTSSSIQDLSADDIVVQKSGSTVTLSIPVESSIDLTAPFTPEGDATLEITDAPANKEFYRFRIPSAE